MKHLECVAWNDVNTYLALLGYFIVLIFLVKRDWLAEKRSFGILLIISLAFFVAALFLDIFGLASKKWGCFSLYIPLYNLLLYRLLRLVFMKYLRREPQDTYQDNNPDTPEQDRLFNIAFFVLSLVIPMIVIGFRITLSKQI